MLDLKETVIGIELGSTRIKAVLLDRDHLPIASGGYKWESKLIHGVWTYDLGLVKEGLQTCFAELKADFYAKYGRKLTETGCLGISAMMHGFLPFDADGNLLTPFRTWRNMMTKEASEELSELFGFTVPQRWSVAFLYDAIKKGEPYIGRIDYMTTLSGYVHYLLSGRRVLGLCDASGMFPIDTETQYYDQSMLGKFAKLTEKYGFTQKVTDIFPLPLACGKDAGILTDEGALILDPTGEFGGGLRMCPPEGDCATGMVATNSVREKIGNVSGGTSIFATVIVKEKPVTDPLLNVLATPSGNNAVMVNVNSCSTEIDRWVGIFRQFADLLGVELTTDRLYSTLFTAAENGKKDCGGLLSMGYVAGEPAADTSEGRSLIVEEQDSELEISTFMRSLLCSPLSLLKVGLNKMRENGIVIEKLYAHGGYFKTGDIGKMLMSAAAEAPVTTMKTAGEGGAYGIALLAAYMKHKDLKSFEDFLEEDVFSKAEMNTYTASKEEIDGFNAYYAKMRRALPVEYSAIANTD
ncbi:MAG: ATPase [Firmicutes bacterium]|nr:ATPase [Candidatus Colimorpha enterica]